MLNTFALENKEIVTKYYEFESAEKMPADLKSLVDFAKKAAIDAYAPYSGFHVGAAVMLQNGKIITGNNQENAAYPSGLCAERVAIFAAASQNPGIPFQTLAITGYSSKFEVNTPISPCGSCRQVIAEYENLFGSPIRIILSGHSGKVLLFDSSESLLPFSFKPDDLNL